MSVNVFFQMPGGAGSVDNLAIGAVRASETVAANAVGSLTAQDGEMCVVHNTSASVTRYLAHGTTPDATATAATAATTARYPIPPNQLVPIAVKAGDKIGVDADA